VAALEARGYTIDRYPEAAAHDFPWRHRRDPYDLIVYQFGNSSHHDYEWPYALRYPGLVVLHDTRLHHARAALLLREKRLADYRAEFVWNEPDVPADAAELAVAGFDSRLYYEWPMVRGLVAGARLVAVHGDGARRELADALSTPNFTTPNSQALGERIVSIRLGEGELLTPEREAEARVAVRARYGIPDEAIVFGCVGGMTPEKRLPQILAAFRATLRQAPSAHLLLAGAAAAHYDVRADIARHGLEPHVTVAGYLERDADLTDHLAACDVSLNLRWPTARETSGPWLRALAAARATIVTDLVHLTDVPSLDPRTWTLNAVSRREARGARSVSGLPERSLLSAQPSVSRQAPRVTGSNAEPPQRPQNAPPASQLAHRTSGGEAASGAAGRTSHIAPRTSLPVCIAIDILDEDHSLRLAMRRLAQDAALRSQLGSAAREWWTREHSVDVMVGDYERVIADAMANPAPEVQLPAHMRDGGDRRLHALLASLGVTVDL
jgi:glycosyltransferase involved in cell wall biosynthesis